MPLKLMIDSGAFAVWNSGKTIDLDEYIRFCKARPNATQYVALDVIPPRNVPLTAEVKNRVAEEGWKNYLKMIRHLPMEKVIPVYHRGDDIRWLETMLDFGCDYIGLAPRAELGPMSRRFSFVNDFKKIVYNSQGNPTIKVHGFAVTSHKMMSLFKWYSVDSATWVLIGAWGGILVPKLVNGRWDFSKAPYRIMCSVLAPLRNNADHHLLAMREHKPALYRIVTRWLRENKIGLGRHKIVPANGQKPKKIVEKWADRQKTKIMKVIEPGVCNYDQVRKWLNAVFFMRCNDNLDVDNVYLAGQTGCYQVEEQIRYRLLSYADSKKTIDAVYPMIGWQKTPLLFPKDEELIFSMKARHVTKEPTSAAE